MINLVGILSEWGDQNFDNIHSGGAATVAKVATDAGVKRFVHMSALGASSKSPSVYA